MRASELQTSGQDKEGRPKLAGQFSQISQSGETSRSGARTSRPFSIIAVYSVLLLTARSRRKEWKEAEARGLALDLGAYA